MKGLVGEKCISLNYVKIYSTVLCIDGLLYCSIILSPPSDLAGSNIAADSVWRYRRYEEVVIAAVFLKEELTT